MPICSAIFLAALSSPFAKLGLFAMQAVAFLPQASWAAFARRVLSTPPENATMTRP